MREQMHIPTYDGDLPGLTTAQMIEVDRLMLEVYHIDLPQMMENAGRCLAHLARQRFLGGDPRGTRVAVLAGTGGNGGGALVAARRLYNYGAAVEVVVTKQAGEFTEVPARQLAVLRHMGLPVAVGAPPRGGVDLVLDGLIGYNLSGAPQSVPRTLIEWANRQPAPLLALDVPSGLDATSGQPYDPTIRAAATMTLALPKTGLYAPEAANVVGELYLADISVPPLLYAEPSLGLAVGPIFATSDIWRLR